MRRFIPYQNRYYIFNKALLIDYCYRISKGAFFVNPFLYYLRSWLNFPFPIFAPLNSK